VIRVRKEWTLKQAREADKRYRPRKGKGSHDPHRPSAQWYGLHDLDEEEARFQAGDQYALAAALRICANHALPMPPWVATAYIRGFDAIHCFQTDSWETLFGRRILKGQHLIAQRKKWELAPAVWLEVQKRKARKPIDDLMFAAIGKKLGISVSLAKEYYALEKEYNEREMAKWAEAGNPIGELLAPYRNLPKK
jgi:hypothetical protein